jgi:hypothetical protein
MNITPQWSAIILTVFSVLLVPALAILLRGAVKWTRTEDQLATLVGDVGQLVADKDKVHAEILEQMRIDRDATDRRLRYIEEFWMEGGRRRRGFLESRYQRVVHRGPGNAAALGVAVSYLMLAARADHYPPRGMIRFLFQRGRHHRPGPVLVP